MEQSASIESLAKALSQFQGKIGNVIFDSNNPFFKSKYASLSAIVNTAKPLLAQCGLSVSQLVGGNCSVTTILMHGSGEWIRDTLTLEPVKKDPQGYGSAITYARRYAYASILGIVSDDDDDGNHATDLTTPKKEEKEEPIRDIVSKLAKEKFKSTDEYKLWRVENGLVEDLKTSTDFQMAKLYNYLKAK